MGGNSCIYILLAISRDQPRRDEELGLVVDREDTYKLGLPSKKFKLIT